ncbi:MAG TPA: RluA family pseudouridine synthase [Gemmatimonadetes bacterium]|nr:RluA family pseudouridine synthase [Gemmatimonadota bacterium]
MRSAKRRPGIGTSSAERRSPPRCSWKGTSATRLGPTCATSTSTARRPRSLCVRSPHDVLLREARPLDGTTHRLTVPEGDEGRLDSFIAGELDLSRTRVQKLLAAGMVLLDGAPAKKSDSVFGGAVIEVVVPAPESVEIEAEDLPIDVVYEDSALLVVNKAAGMVVHPAPGHRSGTLVNALMFHVRDLSGVGGRLRPGIVHRLDRHTSGLLVVAKNDEAHQKLSDALRRRDVKRLYHAAVWGHLADDEVTIDAPIGRDRKDRKRMAVVDDGRSAVSRATVSERWKRVDFLHVALKTGRTHQIRVHLLHIGHPVVGDPVYGVGWERGMGGPTHPWAKDLARRVPRQFLHAAELVFVHPISGEKMRFEVPLPDDLARAAAWARGELP